MPSMCVRSSGVEIRHPRRECFAVAFDAQVVIAGEVLAPAEGDERDDRLVGQRDAAHAVRLRRVLLRSAGREIPTDVKDSVREVDVPPADREQLALA